DMDIAREAMSALEYLRRRGVVADLAIINERATSYAQDMQHALDQMADNLRHRLPGGRQHVFTVRDDLQDEGATLAVLAAARVVLHTRNGKIVDQVNRAVSLFATPRTIDGDVEWPGLPPSLPTTSKTAQAPDGSDLDFWNGFGGFSKDGTEYVVRLDANSTTPHPWINVIANENFGFHVSAEGAGFTWSQNSRDYQVTPWTNDPVINRPGEGFYVADLDSGRTYATVSALNLDPAATFEARHGLGYSTFVSRHGDLEIELTQTVDRDRPVKLSKIRLKNTSGGARKFRIYGYAEWVLGNNPARTAPFVLSTFDEQTGALFASNPYDIDHSGRYAFLAGPEQPLGYTTSRREFIGRNGTIKLPQAVARASTLTGSIESESDPCAAIAFDIQLAPGQSRDMTFLLGETDTAEAAADLVRSVRAEGFETILNTNRDFWTGFTGKLSVETGDKAFDNLVNRWLPYQALACRIFARAGF
ncbi:MAG: protein ndvB, partial [Rhizobium rhizophilum]